MNPRADQDLNLEAQQGVPRRRMGGLELRPDAKRYLLGACVILPV